MPTGGHRQARRGAPPKSRVHHGLTPDLAAQTHVVQRQQSQPPQSAGLHREGVAYLQKAAGNQAISRFLGSRRTWPTTAQRDIENEFYGESISDAEKASAQAFFAAFNVAVDTAHKYVISVPSLGAWAKLNGHTRLWSTKWADFLSGGRPKLMAAAFGYVIESLVSEDTDFRPSPPAGCTVFTQVTSGGTRPDLVLRLKKGGHDLAWLDLTASGSVNHIYDKEGWGQKVGIFAEVTYPSLDPGTLAFMVQNKDNKGALTEDEFKKRQETARAAYIERKRHWLDMGKGKYSVGKHRRALARIGRMKIEVNPGLKRSFIKMKLEKGFDTKIDDEKMIPSILRAMGVSPASWEFGTGYSESERAGEAWLVDHDTTLPSSDKPEEPVVAGAEDSRPSAGGRTKERPKARAGSNPY